MAVMGLSAQRSGSSSLDDKPLPLLPRPSSPTLTNPDMVLPDELPDDISLSSPPKPTRPPSPSYLVEQNLPERGPYSRENSHVSQARHGLSYNPGQDYGKAASPYQSSAARRAQYKYSEAALGSSPTVSVGSKVGSRRGHFADDGRRFSVAASSINSEDLDAMRPDFAGLDDDDDDDDDEDDGETLDGTELDVATPSERWHAGEQMEPPETEESAVTLMRAELILANAKKRLNLMSSNLRGAREMVAPLTAANLKRATSLSSAFSQSAHYGRPRYIPKEPPEGYERQQAERPQTTDALGHYRGLSDPVSSPIVPERPYTSMNRPAIPVSRFSPSWTSNPLRGSRSQEQLKSSGRSTPRPLLGNSPEPQLETLLEHEPPRSETSSGMTSHRTSAATDLREQMQELKGRISSLKERAREDNLRRRSMQNLRTPCPLIDSKLPASEQTQPGLKRVSSVDLGKPLASLPDNPSPPLTEDGQLVFDPHLGYTTVSPRRSSSDITRGQYALPERALSFGDSLSTEDDTATSSTDSSRSSSRLSRTSTELSEEAEVDSVYEDASDEPVVSQRHEDREDAFDYGNFFLHSSMGTFSRPRGSSFTSTDSGETARGPSAFDQVPPTPETPETLREIERSIHTRALSTESIESMASFATAQEAMKSGRQTPLAMAEWLVPKSKDGRTTALADDRADSGVGIAEQAASKAAGPLRSRSRSVTQGSYPSFPSPPVSSASAAVSALLSGKGRPLGLRDNALVFAVVENLKHICEKLQTADEGGQQSHLLLRKRLEQARKMLDGSIPPL